MSTTFGLIDPDDAVMLLIDHQSGLFQVVNDQPFGQVRRNAVALAKLAKIAGIPVITTASVPQGPNGPLMPEIHQIVPDATYVHRNGEINAWDTPAFREAVAATGRKTLIVAAVITSVCLVEPALSALADGYQVYAVIDASGTYSKVSQQTAVARLVQAGAIPIDTAAVASEVQRSWNRPDAAEFAELYSGVMTNYQLLIESYGRAQAEATGGAGADAERQLAAAK
ncbi:isochorismatase family protein [Mycolicibacterium neworleansense]|uniref:Isochorismatase family protein n=1 Tax=Mycolicibacterium neworleansense TaxID=146018 RepID=A0A0H5S6U3_9MYCO|nr:isochorismatase family protein [Mycolicibacterium neworleansense]MCV7361581.1 isochorismatase family protein [Mycolicibacterium neworleansense]CRZ16934.1 Isochorismatase family protein [Mycolicibacterium neworleansense]